MVGVRSAPAGLSGESAGVVGGSEVAEARVGPHLVEVAPPGFELGAGVRQGAEQGLVQQFVAQLAIEALAEAVLLGLAGGDVMPADLVLVGPFQEGVGRQFRAVVADDGGLSGILCAGPGFHQVLTKRSPNMMANWVLALQLHIPFDMSFSSAGLMCASPDGPSNDVGGIDPSLRKADGDATDFLDRPADQWRRGFAVFDVVFRRFVFGGGVAFA